MPAVDGLRGVAIIAVVLYHAFPTVLPGGFLGVDVFFVVSGYVIAGLIFDALDEGSFRVSGFYARRIRRLFPSLITLLIAVMLAGWLVLLPNEYANLGRHVAGGAAFAANILLWKEAGYFDVASFNKPLLHLWSLGVEEQFYIVAPFAAMALWRCSNRYRIAVLWGAMGASFIFSIALNLNDPLAAFFSPLTRAWELLAGVQLALCSRVESRAVGATAWRCMQQSIARNPNVVAGVGAGLILATFFIVDERNPFLGWCLAAPVAGTAMVLATAGRGRVNTHWLATAPMVSVGLLSYSLYLWHWPLLAFLRIIEAPDASPTLRGLALLMAVVLAALTRQFIEMPIRHAQSVVVVPGLAGAAFLIGLCGASVGLLDGVPTRTAGSNIQLEGLAWGPAMNGSETCRRRFHDTDLTYCLESMPDRDPEIALLGDSTANQYFWALKSQLDRLGIPLVNLGRHACPVLRNVETTRHDHKDCQRVSTEILETVLHMPSVKTVILADRWYRDAERGLVQADADAQGNAAAILRASLEATVAELSRNGKRVVIMTNVPELPYPATSCIRLRPFYFSDRTDRDRCAISRDTAKQQARSQWSIISAVKDRHPAIALIDPAEALCDERWCHGRIDGRLVYRDIQHLSSAGAQIVVSKSIGTIVGD